MSKPVTIVLAIALWGLVATEAAEDAKTRIKDGIVRGDRHRKAMAVVFTGDSFAEGGDTILETLQRHDVKASFFLTGNFLRNSKFEGLLKRIVQDGHYLGPHSDRHLLYLSWTESRLLVSKDEFARDLQGNLKEIAKQGVDRSRIRYWIPPYEHYNKTIVQWSQELGLTLINYSPGTISHADYTSEHEPNFRSSQQILDSILKKEQEDPDGLNGFILLLHIGAGDGRKDKFHLRFEELLNFLITKHYRLLRVDELL